MNRPSFLDRVRDLPALGVGVSTEYGAASDTALDVHRLRREHPAYARFLELGIETAKGLDSLAEAWVAAGLPTTYHFLDVNLDDPEDFDAHWLEQVQAIVERVAPAWLCGDAGLWHFGGREPGHMLLLPPILSTGSASAMADGVRRLREACGLEVLPENPPGQAFVGDLHLLDYFARVCDEADTGQLLDCAHLAIYQHVQGNEPLDGLDGFPLERVVELHVAGGTWVTSDAGFRFVEDDHTTQVLPDTWTIFEHVVPRCPNLKAVVFECERNALEACLPAFGRLAAVLAGGALSGIERGGP